MKREMLALLNFMVVLPATSCWQTFRPWASQKKRWSSLSLQSNEELSGETLAGKYLLLEGELESTSGKSSIYRGYEKCPNTGEAKGEPVVIKVSDDHEALKREAENFEKLNNDLFVETKEFIEPNHGGSCSDNPNYGLHNGNSNDCNLLQENGALVMERGIGDLRQYVDKYGRIEEPQLRCTASTVVKCIRDMHQKGLVWTDLKAQNLVLVPKDNNLVVKGIDVESAVEYKSNPIDYTPSGSPPEFAIRFLCGSEPFMKMEYNFDIWSLGILLHELATGSHYFEGQGQIEVATHLKNTDGLHDLVNEINDPHLRDLISQCLQLEPRDRPTIDQVAQHPYFSSVRL